jgi:hypothetical protein
MRSSVLSLFLTLTLLTACAGPETREEAPPAPTSTDACLANPALASEWGECNVKTTIYDNMEKLRSCQSKGTTGGATLMLKIQVTANGHVRRVRPESGGPRNRALETCLKQALATVKFAPPPKGVKPVIYFPLQM